jgi:hypothetical protein
MTTPPEPPPTNEPAGYGQVPPPGWTPPPGSPPPPGYYGYAPLPPSDGQAIAAMVIGIVALVGACGYGLTLLISPVALFLGRSSMKRIDASQGRIGGRGFAQAGFILGIIGTILLALAIIAVGVFIAFLAAGSFDTAEC